MNDVNSLLEAARILREAADEVDRWPEPGQWRWRMKAEAWLCVLGFADVFVARQIAEWLEAEAEAALAAGEPPLGAALAVAEKVRRES